MKDIQTRAKERGTYCVVPLRNRYAGDLRQGPRGTLVGWVVYTSEASFGTFDTREQAFYFVHWRMIRKEIENGNPGYLSDLRWTERLEWLWSEEFRVRDILGWN